MSKSEAPSTSPEGLSEIRAELNKHAVGIGSVLARGVKEGVFPMDHATASIRALSRGDEMLRAKLYSRFEHALRREDALR